MAISRATVRAAVRLAFKELKEFVVTADYKSRGTTQVRDIEAGTVSYPTTSYPLKQVAIVQFKQSETDKDPTLLQTSKMIFPCEDLPVQPEPEDTVVDSRGRTWEIIRLLGTPGDIVTILQVRTSR